MDSTRNVPVLPGEQWAPIPGFMALYDASDQGRIRSWNGRYRRRSEPKVLSPAPKPKGHLTLVLCDGVSRSTCLVHALVLAAFVGSRPQDLQIRHLDGDPTNNRLSNLTYGTASQNRRDTLRHGTDHNVNKTHCPQGHAYDGANTYVMPGGWRACKTCRRDRKAAARALRAA